MIKKNRHEKNMNNQKFKRKNESLPKIISEVEIQQMIYFRVNYLIVLFTLGHKSKCKSNWRLNAFQSTWFQFIYFITHSFFVRRLWKKRYFKYACIVLLCYTVLTHTYTHKHKHMNLCSKWHIDIIRYSKIIA